MEWFVNGSSCSMTRRYSFVDITSPDFVEVAKGYHIEGRSVSKSDELKGALKEMIDHDGSYLLEVMVGKENNVFPMVPRVAVWQK